MLFVHILAAVLLCTAVCAPVPPIYKALVPAIMAVDLEPSMEPLQAYSSKPTDLAIGEFGLAEISVSLAQFKRAFDITFFYYRLPTFHSSILRAGDDGNRGSTRVSVAGVNIGERIEEADENHKR